ncbi:MAG TPA: type 1 glutamine amidotransferase domain-containing protein [Caulobacteraceae bacterium]|jgi:protease I
MTERLDGKRVALLATDGFEQAELFTPRDALRDAGAQVDLISLKLGEIQGFDHLTPDKKAAVDLTLDQAEPDDYDALVLPGGANNPDRLRIEPKALEFVRAFFDAGKPVGAICHAPWILINAGVASGRKLTSYKTIRLDLKNAGANVVDEEVVVDGNLITSRQPSDLPAFCAKVIEAIADARPQGNAPRRDNRTADQAGAAAP